MIKENVTLTLLKMFLDSESLTNIIDNIIDIINGIIGLQLNIN